MQIVVIGIIEDHKGRVLIEERIKQDGVPFSFPSGKRQPDGETSEAAISRETKEETNQIVTANKKLGERINPFNSNIILEYWQCQLTEMTPIIPKKDEIKNAWYEQKENLVGFMGADIFQPVKDYLGIL